MDKSAGQRLADGVWWNNPELATVLGLGPLLAGSRTFEAGLALGLASLAVLCTSSVLVSALRHWLDPRVRLPAIILIIATVVTAVDLLFKAQWFNLYGDVGLLVPLILTNSVLLARVDGIAAHQGIGSALLDGLVYGLGCTLLLAGLGALRVGLGQGLVIAALPAGAFFLLAALVALRQLWLQRPTST